jgi:MFS family permease
MINRLNNARKEYPAQFWILFVGMLVSTIGQSMIWPFLTLYVSKKLGLPLAQTAALVSINAITGLAFSLLAGPIVDRLGRKWVMVISLVGNGVLYAAMRYADTYLEFAVIQSLMGALTPLYRVGADAMLADLIKPEKRNEAYSLIRMSSNAGVSIGPAIGGLVASTSYAMAFFIAAIGLSFYGLLVAFMARETLPARTKDSGKRESVFSGYGPIFRHGAFMGFIGSLTLTAMLVSLVWVLLPVYTNYNFQMPESQYGFIPTTNAVMVVTLQYLVTRLIKRRDPMAMMTLGTLLSAVGTVMVAFFSGFWGFWLCMVVITFGELVLVPTATTFTANMAPVEMRGRYMSMYWLTSNVGSTIAPVLGGYLSDSYGGRYIWYGGGVIGVLAVAAFLVLTVKVKKNTQQRANQLHHP